MADEKPQVYAYETTGMMLDAVVTRGEVDLILLDWSIFDDNRPEQEEIDAFRAELERIANPDLREQELASLGEFVEKYRIWDEEDRTNAEDIRARKVLDARKLIAEEDARA